MTSGFTGANVDTVTLVIKGKGGHGAKPHLTIDPVAIASYVVVRLQSIVSREMNPVEEPAVVTVGSFQGGTKENIISDEATLKLTVRSRSGEAREHLLKSIERIAKAEAAASGAPAPSVSIVRGPAAVYNDPQMVAELLPLLQKEFGSENAHIKPSTSMGGEDFGSFAQGGVRIVMIGVGAIEKNLFEKWKNKKAEPYSLHSPFFAPDPEPTIKTAVTSLTLAAKHFLAKK
jgi:hippurate hydrolase